MTMVPTGTTTGVKAQAPATVAEANAKMKDASEKKKAADLAHTEAIKSVLTPAQQKAYDADHAASIATADEKVAGLVVLQAKGNAVLERKIGRKLREGEYARWISGDMSNLRMENVELCSPEILAQEQKTGRHVDDEELWAIEEEWQKRGGDGRHFNDSVVQSNP